MKKNLSALLLLIASVILSAYWTMVILSNYINLDLLGWGFFGSIPVRIALLTTEILIPIAIIYQLVKMRSKASIPLAIIMFFTLLMIGSNYIFDTYYSFVWSLSSIIYSIAFIIIYLRRRNTFNIINAIIFSIFLVKEILFQFIHIPFKFSYFLTLLLWLGLGITSLICLIKDDNSYDEYIEKTKDDPLKALEFCRNCGSKVSEGQTACLTCGFNPWNGSSFCQECGATTKEGQVICVKCGFELVNGKPKIPVSHDSSFGFAFLGFLIPLVGLILYLTMINSEPGKAKSAGKGALISVLLSFSTWIIFAVVGFSQYY